MRAHLWIPAAAMLMGGTALAGVKWHFDKAVFINGNEVTGSMSGARNSEYPGEIIGCTSLAFANGNTTVHCSATDAKGNNRFCLSSQPAHATVVAAMTGDSYVGFIVDANGMCSRIYIEQSSGYAPKAP